MLWRLLLLMATTIASNLAVFSDATGAGNQSHLVYAVSQARWWLFTFTSKGETVIDSYVSSSNDLTTATWSASTSSSAWSTGLNGAPFATDQRNLAGCSIANGSTDAAHLSVSFGPTAGTANDSGVANIRCTFTGASSITWEAWTNGILNNGHASSWSWPAPLGNALGVSTPSKFVHEAGASLAPDQANGYADARISTNADTGATWTNGWGATAKADSQANFIVTCALAPLASDAMLIVYGNGGVAQPNTTGLRSNKYTSGTTWPTTSSVVTGNGTTSQDQNDWCLCGVDTTHVFCIRRSASTTADMQMYSGTAWASKTAPPSMTGHKAGSGMFAATNGTDLWLFILDSTGNNAVLYCKYTVASNTWGSWTTLEAAGSTARNYVSGYPVVGNNQAGVIFTAVNGSNFDVVVTALILGAGPSTIPNRIVNLNQSVMTSVY